MLTIKIALTYGKTSVRASLVVIELRVNLLLRIQASNSLKKLPCQLISQRPFLSFAVAAEFLNMLSFPDLHVSFDNGLCDVVYYTTVLYQG